MRKVTTKVDVFSFGIIMMELVTKKRPTGLTAEDGSPITLSQLVQEILTRGIHHVHEILDPDLKSSNSKKHDVLEEFLQLALFCTSADPSNRPEMKEVLSHLLKIRKMV